MQTQPTPASTHEDPLLRWRKEFPILAHTTYMVSHSLGAMPAAAAAAAQEFTDMWATRGIRAWAEGWWDMPITAGNRLADIIGAPHGSIAMHQNVSICQTIITSCFDWRAPRRNKIVSDGLNFPSNDYIYAALARQSGARFHTVISPDGMTLPLEDMLAAIDEETLLVSVSHVAFRSSFVQDLAAITKRAHEVGAFVVADLYQSAGIVPVDVTALDVDFATGGSVKWLCGGPGAGYLYVHPDLIATLQPAATGWAAHDHPFDFAAAPIHYAPGMERFLNGTPNVPAMYTSRAGYEIIRQIGVPAIRAKSQRQTEHLIALADEAGFTVRSVRNPTQRGGSVILDIDALHGKMDGPAVTAELIRREILVDYRPGAGIRMAPHFYTTDAELIHTIEAMKDILSHQR